VNHGDFTLRHAILRTVIIVAFAILAANLFHLTVIRHSFYQDQALENRQDRFRVRAPRGRIYDRDGNLLVANQYIADIIVPRKCLTPAGPDSTLNRLIEWFGLDRYETLDRLEQQAARRDQLVLVPDASPSRIFTVEERGRELPGVKVVTRSRRQYLFGPLFAHAIGYVGEIGRTELDSMATIYAQGDYVGKLGVEEAMEPTLRGVAGIKLEEVNAAGRIVGQKPVWVRDVVPGTDVEVTLSLRLQQRLAAAIGDRPACAVALDVRTGEVLAAYSSPGFDPNLMGGSLTTAQWNELVNDPDKPLFNRIAQATYPPASLFKTITSLAGLSGGHIGTGSSLEPCGGGWQFGGRYFRCWKKGGHGWLDHTGAMMHSCDTFYYQLGQRLQVDELAAAARAFGLGSRVTTELGDEVRGNVPDVAWYDKRLGKGKWTRGVLMNTSIGQGELLVTPIQMAVVAGRIASGGSMPDPTFVREPAQPRRQPRPLPFRPEHLAWVREAMHRTVAEGTGRAARLKTVEVAGKTGTAQNPHGEDHAWFMCFAPVTLPEVAIAIIMENAGHGGSEAAPVAGAFLKAYFHEDEADSAAVPVEVPSDPTVESD
jgi:penicillin-binding protein 2